MAVEHLARARMRVIEGEREEDPDSGARRGELRSHDEIGVVVVTPLNGTRPIDRPDEGTGGLAFTLPTPLGFVLGLGCVGTD